MKISVNTLYWDNIDPRIVESNKKVMKKFDIPINYNRSDIDHGMWMDIVMQNVIADIYVFFDIDCVPITRDAYDYSLKYVISRNTFIGNAQVSNHIEPKKHIYAAPSFFAISRDCYKTLNETSFCTTYRSDVGEELSYVAESLDIKYKVLYPTKFDKPSETDGVWKLSNYGFYGIGTIFEDKFYHLFQSRLANNVELFEKRCNEIVNGCMKTDRMHNCR